MKEPAIPTLADLRLSTATVRALGMNGIATLEALCQKSLQELHASESFNSLQLEEITWKLGLFQLQLQPSANTWEEPLPELTDSKRHVLQAALQPFAVVGLRMAEEVKWDPNTMISRRERLLEDTGEHPWIAVMLRRLTDALERLNVGRRDLRQGFAMSETFSLNPQSTNPAHLQLVKDFNRLARDLGSNREVISMVLSAYSKDIQLPGPRSEKGIQCVGDAVHAWGEFLQESLVRQ